MEFINTTKGNLDAKKKSRLVAEQLSLAIAWLRYGIRPDEGTVGVDDMDDDWLFLHHRDLVRIPLVT